MWNERDDGIKVLWLVLLSIGMHGVLFALLPTLDSVALAVADAVDIDLLTPEPPPEEPDPPPPPPPPPPQEPELPPPRVRPPPPPRRAEPPPPPPPEAPPPEAPAPVRFDGVTLTNPGAGSGFAITPGSGEDFEGPVRPGSPSGDPNGVPGGTGAAPADTPPPRDLSRRPSPPALGGALQRNFPPGARRRGIAGVAVVSLRVGPTGDVDQIRVQSESVSGQGFGQACVTTVSGSRWTPALNAQGNPAPARVRFRCEFRVIY